MGPADILHPDDTERVLDLKRRLMESGKSFVTEQRFVRKDGSEVWINSHAAPVRNARGEIERAVAVAIDITDRKRSRSANANNLKQEKAARRGAGGQPIKRRIPDGGVARVAQPSQFYPRLRAAASYALGGPFADQTDCGDHRAQRTDATATDRGPARHRPHHQRQTQTRSAAGGPHGRDHGRARSGAPCTGKGIRWSPTSIRGSARSPATPAVCSRSSGTCSNAIKFYAPVRARRIADGEL